MIIFGVEHQRAIAAALSLLKALSKLKMRCGKSDLEITLFSSEIVRTKKAGLSLRLIFITSG